MRVARDFQDDEVGDRVTEDCGHCPEHGEDPSAEVREHAELVYLTFEKFFFGEWEQLRFPLPWFFRGKDDGDALGDAQGAEPASRGTGEGIFGTGADVADADARGVTLAAGAHGADNGDAVGMAVLKERDFAVDVIDGIDDVVRFSAAITAPAAEQPVGFFDGKDLVEALPLHPGNDGLEALAHTVNFRGANVCEGSNGVAV